MKNTPAKHLLGRSPHEYRYVRLKPEITVTTNLYGKLPAGVVWCCERCYRVGNPTTDKSYCDHTRRPNLFRGVQHLNDEQIETWLS